LTVPENRRTGRNVGCAVCQKIQQNLRWRQRDKRVTSSPHTAEADRVNQILTLADKLTRAATRLERDEIKAQIQALSTSYET